MRLPCPYSTAVMTTNITQLTVDLATLAWARGEPDDLARVRPQGSSYASIYVTLVGADHAHVFVGLLLDLWLLARLATGLTNYRLVGLRVVTFYWHFVNVLTVAVVLTQLSPSL